ncbi:ATP-grasp domain-containing protein [Burkholderia gladioli]|uniref:ATP-grasp domain-containing protein n=1 Tax=Burkholderia gladioli TaxID=28095 RepID=UPI0016421B18|nr:ATP-grasp domain-containing protein [Burkholderia gladioli]
MSLHPQPSPGRSRIVVLNRWSDDFAAYHRYIDHDAHEVAYVCTPDGAAALAASRIAHLERLPDFLDEAGLHEAVRACGAALGGIDRLVALSEFDLIAAGRLREAFDIPGDRPAAVARFRDKAVMKQVVAAAGLRVPRFVALDEVDAPDAPALAALRFPLVLKPRAGAASAGVRRVDTPAQLAALWPTLARADHECEEYIEGPIYHVDGLVADGEFVIARASRYVNTCLDFANGKPLGSVMLDPGPAHDALLAFARDSLRALGLDDGAFHLEVIRGGDGLTFLEIGARVGGGEIPFLFRDLYGVDLYDLWVAQQSGDAARFAVRAQAARAASASPLRGGFLMLPEPVGSRFVEAEVPSGIAALYRAVLPKRHHGFDGKGGYDTILARFRYRGASEDEIGAAIDATLREFRYTLADLTAPSRPGWPRGQGVAQLQSASAAA